MDDADEPRLEGRGRPFGSGANELPPFPPGPSDRDAWSRILRVRPDLAPAFEPPLHGMADGLEARLDLPRAARLRITGNGVVPQCASLAFRTLWGQLADTGHTERTGGQAVRSEAKGKHAMSLHHVVEGWE